MYEKDTGILYGSSNGRNPAAFHDCTGDGDAKDTMVVIDSEWYGTDMFQQDGWASAQSLIADSLFTEDPKTGDLLDGICTDWKLSDDGLTATFNVPEGKYYATGEQVEPEDVVASLEYGKMKSAHTQMAIQILSPWILTADRSHFIFPVSVRLALQSGGLLHRCHRQGSAGFHGSG